MLLLAEGSEASLGNFFLTTRSFSAFSAGSLFLFSSTTCDTEPKSFPVHTAVWCWDSCLSSWVVCLPEWQHHLVHCSVSSNTLQTADAGLGLVARGRRFIQIVLPLLQTPSAAPAWPSLWPLLQCLCLRKNDVYIEYWENNILDGAQTKNSKSHMMTFCTQITN